MMTSLVVLATFLASAVEAVEALTIVLAVGLTHGWRTALLGAAAGSLAVAVVVIAIGPALVTIIPLDGLQVLIGVLLLIFGLQWLRKAILRASGLKAMHDEAAIFEEEVAELTRGGIDRNHRDIDWNGFAVSFKGVFLECLEVAFIVLTFGANRGNAFVPAAAGAVLAFVVVTIVGAAVHRPLARVPENSIKFIVGLLLITFGTFWSGEGIGVEWTLGDAMIPGLALIYLAVSLGLIGLLRRRSAGTTSVVVEGV
ncbi:MAG: hypothetical protein EXR66_05865 [Dehalococcoidia bacterium]|nr:hypothetical protein [Dehalococcoidia bacterium]